MNGFALAVGLKRRLTATRKWAIKRLPSEKRTLSDCESDIIYYFEKVVAPIKLVIGNMRFKEKVIVGLPDKNLKTIYLTQDPFRSSPFLGISSSTKRGVAISNMAASRTTDVTLCSCTFSFSLSNSGLSLERTGIARLAEGDILSIKRNKPKLKCSLYNIFQSNYC